MNNDSELTELMQSVAMKSMSLLTNMQHDSTHISMIVEKYFELFMDFQTLLTALFKNPVKITDLQKAYWQDAFGLLQEHLENWMTGRPKASTDKRFLSEEWVNNPLFNLLCQQYLLASEHFNSLLLHLDFGDKQTEKRIQFFMRQYLDALSPDNFFHTNPQLMAETIKSHGKNLLRGLKNLLGDMESGSPQLLMKMTDMDAFTVGKNLAITEGKVVFKNHLMELIQYTPQTPKVRSTPLLIIPPWINKYYILDLSPHNSFVRWLVSQGITVFMISWANPDASYANKGLYDYLHEGPISAINVIKKQLHIKQLNLLGFCIGGTLLAILLAYYKALNNNPIRSATFLASMIDFSDPGDISVFIDEKQLTKLEEKMNKKGYLEGHFMAQAFNSLRASDLIWSVFIRNYLRGHDPVPFDLLYWNADSTNMPAKMHSQYLRWMYLNNDLVKPGKIHLDPVAIDVTKIDTPTFFVSTQKDHIAPWKTTYLGFQLMKGRKRFLLGGSGHIGGIIIPPGTDKYGFYQNHHEYQSPEEWLQHAVHQPGSWWPEWFAWLKKESGRQIKAPLMSELPYKPLMDAPGSYVKVGWKTRP